MTLKTVYKIIIIYQNMNYYTKDCSVLLKVIEGHKAFRKKYVLPEPSIMNSLYTHGQAPKIMVVSCCDSRVDPALILQCGLGDIFVVRNVGNIIPPYHTNMHVETKAALEFGICFLKVKHLILLGHTQCGGIQAALNNSPIQNDFLTNWISIIKNCSNTIHDADEYAKLSLQQSYRNCLTFPWITDKLNNSHLMIHSWLFDIKIGQIFSYSIKENIYKPLNDFHDVG